MLSFRRDLTLFLAGVTVMLLLQGLLLVGIGLALLRPIDSNDYVPQDNALCYYQGK